MIINRLAELDQWRKCTILPEKITEFNHIANIVFGYKAMYDEVEKLTGVPWYVVGALDCREESFNHHGYLGNGDPLYKITTHVPRGRGPFPDWQTGAIDALRFDGMDRLPSGGHWDIVSALIKCEGYNGLGYAHMGIPSPYVWAGTNIQVPGKYVSDGHFDPHAIDHQPGCAGIFLALKTSHNVDLREA